MLLRFMKANAHLTTKHRILSLSCNLRKRKNKTNKQKLSFPTGSSVAPCPEPRDISSRLVASLSHSDYGNRGPLMCCFVLWFSLKGIMCSWKGKNENHILYFKKVTSPQMRHCNCLLSILSPHNIIITPTTL